MGRTGFKTSILLNYRTIYCPFCVICLIVFCIHFSPSTWSDSIIVPVFKKGDCTDLYNYRNINMQVTVFTSILNFRLKEWSECNDVITDAQFGFKPHYGTRDAIFA